LDEKEWDASNINEQHLHANKCDCCGHKIRYSAIAKHIPTNTIASLGRKCASNIESLKKYGSLIESASIALSQKILCNHRENEFRKLHPEACEALDWAKTGLNRVAADLLEKLRRFGSLSDKQISFLVGIHQRDVSNRASATATAPSGRLSVEGVVLSAKEVFCKAATRWDVDKIKYKVLVDIGGGVRVWGSGQGEYFANHKDELGNPKRLTDNAVLPIKGQMVRFSATFESSPKDPLFGFFKRPSKWQVLESVTA
jgi:hypothetical protein